MYGNTELITAKVLWLPLKYKYCNIFSMANTSYLQTIGNAWSSQIFDGKSDGHKDYQSKLEKYFTKNKKGHYELKDGYEQREQSSSKNTLGAEVVYSNYEEDHEDGSDSNHFGIYKIQQPQTVTKTVYKDKPVAAPPKPAPKPKAPVEHSPKIQQAKDRVNAYESNKSSAWDQAQANVQSSFIKSSSSDTNKQYDFSADSFETKESPEPAEKAHAAQDQMQNYISKYSQYKSSSN